jgi:hypothetical protein
METWAKVFPAALCGSAKTALFQEEVILLEYTQSDGNRKVGPNRTFCTLFPDTLD